jgi:alpha,alpha-trehalase
MKKHNNKFILSPEKYQAVIFDLDGVITQTAKVHAEAWKEMFDDYLQKHAPEEGKVTLFDMGSDYRRYVDGKPRYEGVKSFLRSRGIELPYGSPLDSPEMETICGLGNRKNRLFHKKLEEQGVEVFSSSVKIIKQLRERGVKIAVVSSSKNCAAVLEAAGISGLFEVRVDGMDLKEGELQGKPSPDIFLEAARRLGVESGRSIVVEDALAGVEAGKRGGFGLVIGVDREDNAQDLRESGADVVVTDLSEISVKRESSVSPSNLKDLPSALENIQKIQERLKGSRLALFLDYDGTLTPIVRRPEMAVLSEDMRNTVERLTRQCFVAVISGRDLADVKKLVGISSLHYAGSHGFDISGPEGKHLENQMGTDFLPDLEKAEKKIQPRIDGIPGAHIERKKFSRAVHYREVDEENVGKVEEAVDEAVEIFPSLRKSYGKKVFEIQPKINWDKGKALLWILQALHLDKPDVLPLYIGDDVTDEDAFCVLAEKGIGIVVGEETRPTYARFKLKDPDGVRQFFQQLMLILEGENR